MGKALKALVAVIVLEVVAVMIAVTVKYGIANVLTIAGLIAAGVLVAAVIVFVKDRIDGSPVHDSNCRGGHDF